MLKQGKKEKTEKILKQGFKKFQKQEKIRTLTAILKTAIIRKSKSVELSTQIVKRGKRKTTVKTLNVLVSEKSRFSNGYKGILEQTSLSRRDSLSNAILEAALTKDLGKSDSSINFSDTKVRVKFKH